MNTDYIFILCIYRYGCIFINFLFHYSSHMTGHTFSMIPQYVSDWNISYIIFLFLGRGVSYFKLITKNRVSNIEPLFDKINQSEFGICANVCTCMLAFFKLMNHPCLVFLLSWSWMISNGMFWLICMIHRSCKMIVQCGGNGT